VRILLSTFGTMGDILPFARVARALLARGHQVTVHTWDHYLRHFPTGANLAPAGGGHSAAELEATMAESLRLPSPVEQKYRWAGLFYGLGSGESRARDYYENAQRIFAGHDLALNNVLDHLGQRAADSVGLPWASFVSRPPPDAGRGDQVYGEVDTAASELFTRVSGIQRHVRLWREQSPLRTLVACSAHLVPPPTDPTVTITGAWLDAPTTDPLPRPIEDLLGRGPVILCTFGTMADVNGRTAALIEAARASGWLAIVQVLPPHPAPASPSDRVLVFTERLPFSSLFPRLAGVVHHGAAGTSHEAVRAGKPSLSIPHMADQYYWAAVLGQLRLGPPPVRFNQIDVDVIAARMTALREETYARRAAQIAPSVLAENGVAVAATELENLESSL
jgi:sterol 3beta-glucosyltransferase/vancomycin aglycone glucosyltransferase